MLWLLFPLAQAATPEVEPIDATAISAATDICLAAVRADFEAGDMLPSRANAASLGSVLCSKGPAIAKVAIDQQRAGQIQVYRDAKARIDSSRPKAPALSGEVTSADPWVSAMLDRARASATVPSESPDIGIATAAWADVERLGAESDVLKKAIERTSEETRRYLALRVGLWMADCTGEIDLVYPETMPNDTRYTYEEQCRQLTQPHNGIQGADTASRNPGDPGAARR